MGTRQIRYCDLSGAEDGVELHEVQIDQMRIEIDLAPGEYAKLLKLLQPYLDAGRIEASIPDGSVFGGGDGRGGSGRASTTGLTAEERQDLRTWAEEQGIEVPANNRFKKSLVDEWREATGQVVSPDETDDPDQVADWEQPELTESS